MEADVPVLLCVVCCERKPLDQFRRRKRDGDRRHYQCQACANAYMREWRAARRRARLDSALVNFHRYRESPGQLEHLANLVIAGFHGASGFAAEYWNAFDSAREAGDHKAVARYLLGLADFFWVAERAKARRKIADEKRKRRREALLRAARQKYDYW